jgi:hypothetical protein
LCIGGAKLFFEQSKPISAKIFGIIWLAAVFGGEMDRDGGLSRWDWVSVPVVTVDVTGVMLDRATSWCGGPARIAHRYSVENIMLHRVA